MRYNQTTCITCEMHNGASFHANVHSCNHRVQLFKQSLAIIEQNCILRHLQLF